MMMKMDSHLTSKFNHHSENRRRNQLPMTKPSGLVGRAPTSKKTLSDLITNERKQANGGQILGKFLSINRNDQYNRTVVCHKTTTTSTRTIQPQTTKFTTSRRAHLSPPKSKANNILTKSSSSSSSSAAVRFNYNNNNNNIMSSSLSAMSFLMLLSTLLILFSCLPAINNNHLVNGIKLQPEGKEKFYWSGEQFVITCQNNNNIKNVKIRWIGPNGVYITEDRSQRIHAESSGPHGHRLVVMNATAGLDDGPYKCTIGSTDDRTPRETNGFNLTIFKTTNFRDTARHLVLAAGQPGQLHCRAEFDPQVSSSSIGWVKDQRPIEMFNDSAIQVIEYDPVKQLSTLIISPVAREHEGTYTCRAVAVTSQLSKISDFDIQLETNYAPTFEMTSQTVWVESSKSLASRSSSTGAAHLSGSNTNKNQQQEQHLQHKNIFPNNARRLKQYQFNSQQRQSDQQQNQTTTTTGTSTDEIVRLELRCTCQANPPASILWTSTQSAMYVLGKGEPAHILEEPHYEVSGHNSTSILTIGYNLDANWPYRRDTYVCSASNKLGKATKTFTIEQGDPPPAFLVGPHAHYNPQTAQFRFTLLGPNFDPEASSSSSSSFTPQADLSVVPPVDSFRIRAESGGSMASSGSSSSLASSSSSLPALSASPTPLLAATGPATESRTSYGRRHLEPSVTWSVAGQAVRQQQQQQQLQLPQNFTVNLGRLPGGSQRLYLEAHNAVGWSPNATYLGDYYLVSGASSLLSGANPANIFLQMGLSLLVSYLIFTTQTTSNKSTTTTTITTTLTAR